MDDRMLMITCIHEMGHARVWQYYGMGIKRVEAMPHETFEVGVGEVVNYGECEIEDDVCVKEDGGYYVKEKYLIKYIRGILAGKAAELRYGVPRPIGCGQDLEQAKELCAAVGIGYNKMWVETQDLVDQLFEDIELLASALYASKTKRMTGVTMKRVLHKASHIH